MRKRNPETGKAETRRPDMKAVAMSSPRLYKRNNTYYFRQAVPLELRWRYEKREIKVSLKTDSLREATARALDLSRHWANEFAQAEVNGYKHFKERELKTPPWQHQIFINAHAAARIFDVHTIDDAFITKVCRTYVRVGLSEDAEWRASEAVDRDMYPIFSSRFGRGELEPLREQLKRGEIDDALRERLTEFLQRLGYRIVGEPRGYRTLMIRFLEARITEGEALQRRNAGKAVDIEKLAPLEQTLMRDVSATTLTILELVDNWKKGGGRTLKTIAEYTAIARRFEEFLLKEFKITQAVQVKKAHLVDYRKHLEEFVVGPDHRTMHTKTIAKNISAIRTLFLKAIEDELLTEDPTQLVRVRGKRSTTKPRVPFSLEEMRKIFTAGVFAPGERPKLADEDSDFWAPLIAVYSGMRLEEICQLRISDICKDETHGRYIQVQAGDGQSLKTESSRRQVPVHAELKKLGFLNYVEYQRKRKVDWLFPELKPDRFGIRSSAFGKRWNRQTRKLLGISEKEGRRKVFHSFRHGFKHYARECEISEEVHDALTGHAGSGSEGRSYGPESYPLKPLAAAIQKYYVSGLDLSHLVRAVETRVAA